MGQTNVPALSFDEIKNLLGDKEVLIRQLLLHIQRQEQVIASLRPDPIEVDGEESESGVATTSTKTGLREV